MDKIKMPADEDFEKFVLGAILNDTYAQHQALQELTHEDFYYHQHQKLFECFFEINRTGRRVDVISACRWLKDDQSLVGIGGPVFIELIGSNFGNSDVDYYIGKLKELHGRRSMLQISKLMESQALTSKDDVVDIVEDFQRSLSEIGCYSKDRFYDLQEVISNYKDGKGFEEVIRDEVERVACGEDLFEGVRTYFSRLDRLIGGFENGTNNIIGARSSSGKTTFLANLFLNIHEHKPEIRMGFFSLEMKKTRIYDKILCSLIGVEYKKLQSRLLNSEEVERFIEGSVMLRSMNLTIFDTSGISINELKSHTRRECIKNKLDIVFLDYLTLVQSNKSTGNKHQEVDQVSKGLQSIALELDIPMVTLSQLNRNIYGRPDKTPVLADLRESGSIEEDADIVMLLHRPIHFRAASDEPIEDVTQLIVAKSRLIGDLGKVEYTFDKGRYIERKYIEELLPNQVVNSNTKDNTWKSSTSY